MAVNNNPIQITVRIAFFRDKPQSLPATNYMVLVSAAAAVLSTAFLEVSAPFSNNIQLAILQMLVLGVAVAAVLAIPRRIARWRQTIAAIYGTTCVVRCLAFFPIYIASNFSQDSESFFWLAVTTAPFGIWSLIISAFIFKEALEISKVSSFFIALGVNLAVSIMVLLTLGQTVDPVIEPIQ